MWSVLIAQTVLGDLRKIHQSTVSRCLHQVTRIIAEQLGAFVSFRADSRAAILRETGLPETVGVLANIHVPILNPGSRAYLNAGRYHSLNVQLACGAGGEIADLVTRWPGGAPDAHVYAHSALKARLEAGSLAGRLAGDGAHRCTEHVLTPMNTPAGEAEERYEAAHARAMALGRKCIARLRGRTPCLGGRGLNYAPHKVGAIVCACVVLHNVAVATGDPPPDEEGGEGRGVPCPRAEQTPHGDALRKAFIDKHFR